jgi:hypothetical protein
MTDYKCKNCGKRFRRFEPTVSCCVQHGPKECCHFMEVEVTKKGWVKALR